MKPLDATSAPPSYALAVDKPRRTRQQSPVTLREIAAKSGMSIQTVSYVLGGKAELFRPETRNRVQRAAEALGYRPNASAKAMRSGRFNCVSLLLSTKGNRSTLALPMLDAIHDALQSNGMTLQVSRVPDERLVTDGYVPQMLRQSMSDGLLINYTDQIPAAFIDQINSTSLPAVWINSRQLSNCVHPDDRGAGAIATRGLVAAGHRRIAYVDYTWGVSDIDQAHYSVLDRQAGYESAMRDAGLKPWVERSPAHLPRHDRLNYTRAWLARCEQPPTAIVAYSVGIVLPVAAALRSVGLKIPQDVSIVTYGDVVAHDPEIDFTTHLVPQARVGELAAAQLLKRIADASAIDPPTVVPYADVLGRSLAAPPKK